MWKDQSTVQFTNSMVPNSLAYTSLTQYVQQIDIDAPDQCYGSRIISDCSLFAVQVYEIRLCFFFLLCAAYLSCWWYAGSHCGWGKSFFVMAINACLFNKIVGKKSTRTKMRLLCRRLVTKQLPTKSICVGLTTHHLVTSI